MLGCKIMQALFKTIDTIIKYVVVAEVAALGFPLFVVLCAMGAGSGTSEAILGSLGIFIVGCCVFCLIILLALYPDWFSKFVPGEPLIGNVLVRIPIYIIGLGGAILFLRQIWQVAIPDIIN